MMNTFTTTLSLNQNSLWLQRAQVLPIPQPYNGFKYRFVDEIYLFLLIIMAAKQERPLLLFSSRGRIKPELLAIIFFGMLPARFRPVVLLYGEMFQPSLGIKHYFEQLVMRRVDKGTYRFIVASHQEVNTFSKLWNIEPCKVVNCYEYTRPLSLKSLNGSEIKSAVDEKYIFAGGNSFRDFSPLVEVARKLPAIKFVFCTSQLEDFRDLPPNIQAGLVSKSEYSSLIENAQLVIIPIDTKVKRIVGALTYLEAMHFEKFVLVTNAIGASEYIIHKQTGWIVDGAVDSYIDAINWILNPENQDQKKVIENKAKERAIVEFSQKNHIERLFDIVDDVCAEKQIA